MYGLAGLDQVRPGALERPGQRERHDAVIEEFQPQLEAVDRAPSPAASPSTTSGAVWYWR